MITVIVNDDNAFTVERLIATTRGKLPAINLLTYQELFQKRSVPVGCVVFTDFDLLNDFEMDAACTAAMTIRQSGGASTVLNDPRVAMERFELLTSLERSGMNQVEVTRLKGGQRPRKYPLFIRHECGCPRPDTDLIWNEKELDAAVVSLTENGHSLRGRITVSFVDGRDTNGYYRKYGAFRIGDRIIPQHILRSPDWIVKSSSSEFDDAFIAEEIAFIQDNPHAAQLLEIFQEANIEFGRIDYTLCEGEIVVFEINTNPTFPNFGGGNPKRAHRKSIILAGLTQAFEGIDVEGNGESISFALEYGVRRYLRSRWTPKTTKATEKRTWIPRRWVSQFVKLLLAMKPT